MDNNETGALTSSRPYLLRGFYEWIVDNSLTPYILVNATHPGVMVPPESVVNGQIVLNINSAAVQRLTLDNDAVRFGARFAGTHWEICVPVGAVLAIYAKENGRGITFSDDDEDQPGEPPSGGSSSPASSRPQLKLVT
ncbi:MAG: ClpXP protease specificity-enhancing factor [Immundisolibacteraceae bacterium]|nr:ClpXP protease specificity-enhancing factor [Immundisolibacteraceae bacterium]